MMTYRGRNGVGGYRQRFVDCYYSRERLDAFRRSLEEAVSFCGYRLGLEVVKVFEPASAANLEFLFRRSAQPR